MLEEPDLPLISWMDDIVVGVEQHMAFSTLLFANLRTTFKAHGGAYST